MKDSVLICPFFPGWSSSRMSPREEDAKITSSRFHFLVHKRMHNYHKWMNSQRNQFMIIFLLSWNMWTDWGISLYFCYLKWHNVFMKQLTSRLKRLRLWKWIATKMSEIVQTWLKFPMHKINSRCDLMTVPLYVDKSETSVGTATWAKNYAWRWWVWRLVQRITQEKAGKTGSVEFW